VVAVNVLRPSCRRSNSAPLNTLAGFEGTLTAEEKEGKGEEGREKERKDRRGRN